MIYKIISVKTKYGKYTSRVYRFNDDNHYQNWYNKVESNGGKIVGCYSTENR